MLRQLARLTRPCPAAGPEALAIAIYADGNGAAFGANERGPEGVACVDDAARAVLLLSGHLQLTGNRALVPWLRGLLDFVLWMGAGDGLWHNFIEDWEGTVNRVGPTSEPGINFWQARATEASISAGLVLEDAVALARGRDGLAAAAGADSPSDVRSVQAAAALALLDAEPGAPARSRLQGWCDEIASESIDGVLMNSPDERGAPHLWAHTQEGLLATAAARLQRPALLAVAQRSAALLWDGLIESGFALPSVQPYGVQSGILAMDALARATGAEPYRVRARQARDWFDGRNPAREPVYDRRHGRVADGIDEGILNSHSGAESNLAGGLALARDPFVLAQAAAWSVQPQGLASRAGRPGPASSPAASGSARPER